MQVAFLTNCLRQRNLEEIIAWAGAHHFAALELAAFPPQRAPDPNLDVDQFDAARAEKLLTRAAAHKVQFVALGFNENMLARNRKVRQQHLNHLCRVIDAAQLLRVDVVSAFVGRDDTRTLRENLDDMQQVFPRLLDYAGERGIRIAIENCPMVGWQFEGLAGNIAYAPDIWDEMFTRLPHKNFGLNLDPSHLVWLGVDYYAAARDYAPRVFHTHAKDTEVFENARARVSILNSAEQRWWRYRIPGLGQVDWRKWISTLRAGGYDGALSIEHEDPVYGGSEARIQEGLLLGKRHLEEALK